MESGTFKVSFYSEKEDSEASASTLVKGSYTHALRAHNPTHTQKHTGAWRTERWCLLSADKGKISVPCGHSVSVFEEDLQHFMYLTQTFTVSSRSSVCPAV